MVINGFTSISWNETSVFIQLIHVLVRQYCHIDTSSFPIVIMTTINDSTRWESIDTMIKVNI